MWWKELSCAEIMSMHGIEVDDHRYNQEDEYDCDSDCDYDFDPDIPDYDCCDRCGGIGCNWCLMTDY